MGYNKKQAQKEIQRCQTFITDADHDYTQDEIMCRYQIENERTIIDNYKMLKSEQSHIK